MIKDCCECRNESTIDVVDANGDLIPYCDKHYQEICEHTDQDDGVCLDCDKDCYEEQAIAACERADNFRKYGE